MISDDRDGVVVLVVPSSSAPMPFVTLDRFYPFPHGVFLVLEFSSGNLWDHDGARKIFVS